MYSTVIWTREYHSILFSLAVGIISGSGKIQHCHVDFVKGGSNISVIITMACNITLYLKLRMSTAFEVPSKNSEKGSYISWIWETDDTKYSGGRLMNFKVLSYCCN